MAFGLVVDWKIIRLRLLLSANHNDCPFLLDCCFIVSVVHNGYARSHQNLTCMRFHMIPFSTHWSLGPIEKELFYRHRAVDLSKIAELRLAAAIVDTDVDINKLSRQTR